MPKVLEFSAVVVDTVTRKHRVKGELAELTTVVLQQPNYSVIVKGLPDRLQALEMDQEYCFEIHVKQTKLETEEEQQKTYTCRYCGEIFTKPLELAGHVKTMHRKEDQEK